MSSPLDEPLLAPAAGWTGDLVGDVAEDVDAERSSPQRTWFGWSATSLPVAPLLLLGILLGPQGLFVLTPDALAAVNPALPVALATLGALLGLMPGLHPPRRRSLSGAALSAVATGLVVAIGFSAGAFLNGELTRASLWLVPLTLGIAAATSLIVPVRHLAANRSVRITLESEALVSVVAGGLLIAFARQGTFTATALWLVQACGVVAVLGMAGWLLLRHSVANAERRVFAVATLLLVGGAADALSFSALLGGLCAGLLWNALGGPSRDSLQRDMLYALHPLMALVLVVAGARVEISSVVLGLATAYACLRMLGRYVAHTLTGRLARVRMTVPPFAPGLLGVAFALTAFRALGSDLAGAVSIVVVGTILSDVTALLVTPLGDTE